MSTADLPPRPDQRARHAGDRRRAAGDRRGRHPLQEPHRRAARAVRRGTTVAGVFTKSKCPSAPVEWCRANLKSRQGPRAGGQFRQCQCLHRQERPRLDQIDRRHRVESRRLQDRRDFPRLDRRHRRAARRHEIRAGDGGPERARARRRLRRRRQGDHDHRHVPEGRHRDRQDRQGQGHHQRHRQGRRHDRARHGDDAVLRLHRRRDLGAGACRRCSRTASPTRSTPSPSTATPRPPTR